MKRDHRSQKSKSGRKDRVISRKGERKQIRSPERERKKERKRNAPCAVQTKEGAKRERAYEMTEKQRGKAENEREKERENHIHKLDFQFGYFL